MILHSTGAWAHGTIRVNLIKLLDQEACEVGEEWSSCRGGFWWCHILSRRDCCFPEKVILPSLQSVLHCICVPLAFHLFEVSSIWGMMTPTRLLILWDSVRFPHAFCFYLYPIWCVSLGQTMPLLNLNRILISDLCSLISCLLRRMCIMH